MILTLRKVLTILILSFFTLGCVSEKGGNSLETLGNGIYEVKNIAYGSHREQKMDVYLPKRSGPHPVMFIVHGGGWHGGDKSDYNYSVNGHLSQGFAVVNINYRMGNMSNTLEQKLDDIHSAVNFMYSYKDQWNISDDLTITGGSAGGHMVLQYGFTLGLDHVDRIISYAGPTDLSNPFYVSNNLIRAINALFKSKRPSEEELKQGSPLYSIPDQPGPPVMMIHGNSDLIVDFEDSKRLHQKLIDAGWDSSLIEIPDAGHEFEGTDWNWVYSIFQPWLDSHVWP